MKAFRMYFDRKLAFSNHSVSVRGNSKLASLRRNLKRRSLKLRVTAFCSLIGSSLEFSLSVWSPFKKMDLTKLEKLTKSYMFCKYKYTDSVLKMFTLGDLYIKDFFL